MGGTPDLHPFPTAMNEHDSHAERTRGGFVIALYLASALLLLYIVFRVVLDHRDRLARPDDATAQAVTPPPFIDRA